MHCGELIHRIKGALSVRISNAQVDIDTEDLGALSLVHPAHKATVLVFAEKGDARQPLPTVAVFVLIDDWETVSADIEVVTRLMQLNTALMSCAIGVVPLNDDERVTALCRRLPAAEIEPEDVLELLEGMIWEYAHAAGFIEQAAPAEA